MRHMLMLALLVSLVVPAAAQKKKKSDMPQVVAAAQFVYVTSFHGDAYARTATSEDRAAIATVENMLRGWGKYRIAYRPDQADIMLVVRPGAWGNARVGVDIGNPPIAIGRSGGRVDPRGGSIGTASVGGGDVSNTPEDSLFVSIQPQEPADAAPFVWRRSSKNGLQGKKPELLEEFRKAVDEAEKQATSKP
jgi:hypothetical protein